MKINQEWREGKLNPKKGRKWTGQQQIKSKLITNGGGIQNYKKIIQRQDGT